MLASQPHITLNNGVELPALGFGVFQTPSDVTQAAVEEALRVGYRMIDTSASYLNEPEVGAALAASGVDRSEVFIQMKAWVSDSTRSSRTSRRSTARRSSGHPALAPG
jgi:diketogulonate reductase-like aldo/keto reductase